MTQSRKDVLRQTLQLLLGEAVCVGIMCLVYVLLGKFNSSIVLGGLVGALVAVGNFFSMAVVVTLAADRAEKQDVEGGQRLVKGSYPIRLLVMAVILFLCAKSGYFDVIALVLPLIFVRPILTIVDFFGKKGE